MARNVQDFSAGVNLGQLPSPPSSPRNGDFYYDTTLGLFQAYQNGSWVGMGGSSPNPIDLAQIATPSPPSTGHDQIYFKNDDLPYRQTAAGVETPLLASGSAAFATYQSSQVTTASSVVGGSFTTFDNSPALTFTPTISGTYKVYCTATLDGNSGADPWGVVRIFNTGGSATLLAESQGGFNPYLVPSGRAGSASCQSVYTLVAGQSYVFDLQGKNIGNGTITADGSNIPFVMFAEGIGLNGTLNTGSSSFAIYDSNPVTVISSAIPYTSPFTTFSNSPAFTFTPAVSGIYKVYSTVPLEADTANNQVKARVWNTSGGATLVAESQGQAYVNSSGAFISSVTIQSTYQLVGGQPYVFDIQGIVASGTGNAYLRGDGAQFYMFAEGVGLIQANQNFPVNFKASGSGSWSAGNPIALGTTEYDSNSAYDNASGHYVVPYSGYYLVGWDGNYTGGTKQVQLYVNGSATSEIIDNTGTLGAQGLVMALKLNANDVLTWVANIAFSTNITTQWVSSVYLPSGTYGPNGAMQGSAFAFYASSPVTTQSAGISGGFQTFSTSPAFTFTPVISGTYKVYSNVSLYQTGSSQEAAVRVWNTSGGAALLQESQGEVYATTGGIIDTAWCQSVYSLVAGKTYVFDLQGANTGGTLYIRGGIANFYMFAEGVGLNGNMAAPVTPWVSTRQVVPSASFGAYSNLQTFSRIVGDTMEFRVSMLVGSSTAAPMALGLPAGLQADATKLSSLGETLDGFANSLTTSGTAAGINTAEWQTYPFFDGSDVNNVYFTAATASGAFSKMNALNFAESGANWYASFKVPIKGLYGAQQDAVSTLVKSLSTGTFSFSGAGPTQVMDHTGLTPISVTLETNGGDILVGLCSDGSGNGAGYIATDSTPAVSYAFVSFYRDGAYVGGGYQQMQDNISINILMTPASGYSFIDSPPAGTHTYTVYVGGGTNRGDQAVVGCKLFAKPLGSFGAPTGAQMPGVTAKFGVNPASSGTLSVTAGVPIVFPFTYYDTNSAYNATNGQFTAPVSGYYDFQATCFFPTTVADTYVNVNGVNVGGRLTHNQSAITSGTLQVFLNAGDVATIVYDTSTTLNYSALTGTDVGYIPTVSITLAAQAPSVSTGIGRLVSASAYMNTTTNIGANSPITFDTVSFDTDNAYATGTGLYTAPFKGTYRVSCALSVSSSNSDVFLAVNGAAYLTLCQIIGSAAASGTAEVQLNQGDTVAIWIDTTHNVNGGTAPINSSFSIELLSGAKAIGPTVWTPYTPTFSGITVSSSSFWYKFDGTDSILIKGTMAVATTSASEAQVSLPPGYTSQATKVFSPVELCGYMAKGDNVAVNFTVLLKPSVGYINFGYQSWTTGGLTPLNGSDEFTASTYSIFTNPIPIS
jgi:hypothetical protein